MNLIDRAVANRSRAALISSAATLTYGALLDTSQAAAARLLHDTNDLAEARIAFLTPREPSFVAVLWAIWRAGGIAVPLCDSHASAEIDYVLRDADVSAVIVDPDSIDRIAPLASALGIPCINATELLAPNNVTHPLPLVATDRRAMMIYTSGTTGKPKGVVTTHANLAAQCSSLSEAWAWSRNDVIANVLPLHHVHGIVNVVLCTLWNGASCVMMPRFDAAEMLALFAQGSLTLFMAVPTIYAKLIAAFEALSEDRKAAVVLGCSRIRLMVSGSAALPAATLERWHHVSGHVLLERYGMTEFGMALGNPLLGERRPGSVGLPLPGVEVRLIDNGASVPASHPGEIEVRSPGIFLEYWRQPETTASSFREGWFRTGDIAVLERGYHRILGRSSVDIIKSGGFKLSALEIEEALREHPKVRECAIIGDDDPEWGERVCAVLVLHDGTSLSLAELRAWAKDRLASYKLPSRLMLLDELPRNALGKVLKPELKQRAADSHGSS